MNRSRSCDTAHSVKPEFPQWATDNSGEHPILLKVGRLGSGYKAWVHKPELGKPRFFSSSLLESITRTPWWVVPLLWAPTLSACLAVSFLSTFQHPMEVLGLVATGFLLWQLMEYVIHRWVFHSIPDHYWGITAHFLFHGCHHKYPMDASRLVFPPVPAAAVAACIYSILQLSVPQGAVLPVFTGTALGYLAYDCLHYCMHHGVARQWFEPLRRAHLHHHFKVPEAGFGISSPLFDCLLASRP